MFTMEPIRRRVLVTKGFIQLLQVSSIFGLFALLQVVEMAAESEVGCCPGRVGWAGDN